jgi:hypothetical protein
MIVELRTRQARHQFDRRRARLGAVNVVNARWVTTIFCVIGSIDLLVDLETSLFQEGDVFLHVSGLDAAFMPRLNAAEPGRGAPVHRPDAQVIADAHNPDGRMRSVPSLRIDAIRNSSAVPSLLSSSLVQVVISTHPCYSNILQGKDQGANQSLKCFLLVFS